MISYIWREIQCDDVRGEIYHFKDDSGQQKVDPNVKNAYAGVGFRWKTLTNDPATGKRAQVMQLARPNNEKVKRQEPF